MSLPHDIQTLYQAETTVYSHQDKAPQNPGKNIISAMQEKMEETGVAPAKTDTANL